MFTTYILSSCPIVLILPYSHFTLHKLKQPHLIKAQVWLFSGHLSTFERFIDTLWACFMSFGRFLGNCALIRILVM